jgi:hypothetical protein
LGRFCAARAGAPAAWWRSAGSRSAGEAGGARGNARRLTRSRGGIELFVKLATKYCLMPLAFYNIIYYWVRVRQSSASVHPGHQAAGFCAGLLLEIAAIRAKFV